MFKSKIKKALILTIVFFFVIMVGGCNLIQMNPEAEKEQTVAEIGEEEITKQQFNYYYAIEKLNWKLQDQEFPTEEEQLSVLKSQILDAVVQNEMLVQLAKAEEIPADEEGIDTQVEEMKAVLQEDIGGEEEYKKYFEEEGITVEEFDVFLKEYFLSNQYISGLFDQVTEDVTVSEEDVEQYYQENINQFDQSTIEAKHILASTKEQAEEIVGKVKEGKDFDELMEEYKEQEGILEAADLGEFVYGKMVPEFSEAAFALEPGEVSEPVQSQWGFHVIKLEKKNEKPAQPLEEVQESLTAQLEQSAKQEAFSGYMQEQEEKLGIKKYPDKL